jgi:DNA-binding NtrC family response regulator
VRNALIVNGSGFIPCSPRCDSLINLLSRARAFDRIHETSIESPAADPGLAPDVIVPRFMLGDWARHGIELCKEKWASARTFAVICDRDGQRDKISTALIKVDDFVFCPYQENELLLRLKRLLKIDKAEPPGEVPDNFSDRNRLVGDSESFLLAVEKVRLLAQSKAPVVISGETGSGKELLARAIHYQSARKGKPFIPVNCGALPDDLFENELFGHAKGAYTSASTSENGLITEAEGGTLFLDEVDTLSPAAQVKLLRFLQSGEYRPLGSAKSMVADVRVLSATNTDLSRCVEMKLFREDLHYRLNVLALTIPALRDRGADVIALARHFLTLYAREHDRLTPQLSPSAIQKLLSYAWPGNVRELESVMQRAIVLQDADVLSADGIELGNGNGNGKSSQSELFRQGKSLAIGQFERNFLANLLALHGGNISRAAKAAGKDRRSFQRLVNKYSLDRKSFQIQ